ncbi:MAG TPA: LysR substrate-binding domain-containing protein [Kineosporiaceae bacterium]|nr:LysR substrate-binding domain-containing protein [Kineosporiaceae bacterium]
MPAPLDVTSLRIIRAIADAGTITGAAAAIGYSQPAVSQHVRRLERRLGTALLERSGRGVRLTEAGQVIARHGAVVGAALEAASAEVAALSGLQAGRVRLMAFPSSSATIVPAALATLRARHPGLAVTLTEAEPPESIERLREGSCDVAIAFAYPGTDLGRGKADLAGLVTRHLLDDPPVLALPAGHRLAARRRVHLQDLAAETWIAGCPRCRGHLLQAGRACGFEPEIAYATDDYVAVLGFVAAGLGVALLPGLVRATAQRHPGVAVRAAVGSSARGVHAVTTPDLLRVPAVAATLQALAESAGVHRAV